jgi:molybdopterin-guanine dinucleotide biosynthesis protein A
MTHFVGKENRVISCDVPIVSTDLIDNTTYKNIDDRFILKKKREIKKLIEEMYKRNSISKEMKAYLLPKDARPGRVLYFVIYLKNP